MKHIFFLYVLILANPLQAVFNLNAPGTGYGSPPESTQYPPSTNSQNNPSETPPSLNLDDAMSPAEQRKTGIYRLNDNQKIALANWIQSRAQTISEEGEKLPPNAVEAIISDGRYVKTADGTVWNISPNAWLYTYYWKKGEILTISKGPDTLFPYSLNNPSTPNSINAKKAASNIETSFQNSYTISKITNHGRFVELNNGSLWEIESSARYMVAGWSKGETVFVTKISYPTGQNFEIFNGVTSRSAQATMKRPEKIINNKAANKSTSDNNNTENNNTSSNADSNTPQKNESDSTDRSEGP